MTDSYPEHEKLKAVEYDHSLICSFIEWLTDHKHLSIAEWDSESERYWPTCGQAGIETLIAEFFEIDRAEFLREKERMYQAIRAAANRALAKEKGEQQCQ